MTVRVLYKPSFVRDYKKLPTELQHEVRDKITLFTEESNHETLKVHKLKGALRDCYRFSVNYSHRIVFTYEQKGTAVLLSVGDHDVYK